MKGRLSNFWKLKRELENIINTEINIASCAKHNREFA